MSRPPSTRGTALVVDDDSVTVRVVEAMLGLLGYDVDAAADGHEALFMLKRGAPDVVLLDIQMPNMDGLTMLDSASRLGAISDSTKVIAMSGLFATDPRLAGKLAARGVKTVLAKPVGLAALRGALDPGLHGVGPAETIVDRPDAPAEDPVIKATLIAGTERRLVVIERAKGTELRGRMHFSPLPNGTCARLHPHDRDDLRRLKDVRLLVEIKTCDAAGPTWDVSFEVAGSTPLDGLERVSSALG